MEHLWPFLTVALVTVGTLVSAWPCDIYASGGTPCVAAHSTTRALFGQFSGPLYQVTRGSDNKTMDVYPQGTGGVANAASQDSFCNSTTCLINIIYDQTANGNHLTHAPNGSNGAGPEPGGYDFVASATAAAVTLNGQKAYGVFGTNATGYRIDVTKGVATGNQPEGIYAVVDGTHYDSGCCYDYGNAERNNRDTGKGSMEALYFGQLNGSSHGAGNGPWFQADLENGIWGGSNHTTGNPNNPSITYRFASGFLKGNDTDQWAIRGGDANSGNLSTFYSGVRPPSYFPMNKTGSIILGIGGDNSRKAQGTFYEGAMTAGYPSDETENQVHAEIVAAGYATTSQVSGPALQVGSSISIESNSTKGMYISQAGVGVNLTVRMVSSGGSSSGSATFTVRNGNNANAGCFSFEAVNQPGAYLRAWQYGMILDTAESLRYPYAFPSDSTFCPEAGFTGSGTTAFRSWNYPTRYMRNIGGIVAIGTNGGPFVQDDASSFDSQTSWVVVPGLSS